MSALMVSARVLAWTAACSLALALPAWGQTASVHSEDPADVPLDRVIAPRYLLMTPTGRSVTSEDFRGRLQLIAFGYTSCPDVCPTTLLEMTHILSALGERARYVQPIFITIDPQRDTAQVLGAYTLAFDSRILGLTGSPELVQRAADGFKVRFEKIQEPGAGPNAYTMDHSAGMYLLGPDGTLVAKFGYGAPVDELIERIKHWLTVAGK